MKIGDGPTPPPATSSHYEEPAEELYHAVLDAFEDASMLARLSLASALEGGERDYERLPAEVRALFAAVVKQMGIGD